MARIRTAAAVALIAMALLAPPAGATTSTWKVTATGSGTALATANGDFANNGAVYATVGINYADLSSNKKGVYVEVEFWFFRIYGPGLPSVWQRTDVKQTARTQSAKSVPTNLSTRLPGDGHSARAKIKVCEDVPRRGDVCSPQAQVSFDY